MVLITSKLHMAFRHLARVHAGTVFFTLISLRQKFLVVADLPCSFADICQKTDWVSGWHNYLVMAEKRILVFISENTKPKGNFKNMLRYRVKLLPCESKVFTHTYNLKYILFETAPSENFIWLASNCLKSPIKTLNVMELYFCLENWLVWWKSLQFDFSLVC